MNDKLHHDLEFIARMLHEAVIVNGNKSDFYVCEAWAVAKKYIQEELKK